MAKKQPQSDRSKQRSSARNAAQDPRWTPFGGRARLRRDPFVRQVALEWRQLTDAGPTLIACSGGADSIALALALLAVSDDIALGHVVHDMRPRAEALRDRDSVTAFAEHLGARCLMAEVGVRHAKGNAEGVARRERYRALVAMARAEGIPFIATAHHATDQFETMLMAVLRGAGVEGMRGVAQAREVAPGVLLVRPMLNVTRDDARAFLERWKISWVEDATNADTTRLRSALRADIIPRLELLRPGASGRASRTARQMDDAHAFLDALTDVHIPPGDRWPREELAALPNVLLSSMLRKSARSMLSEAGRDRIGSRRIAQLIDAIRDAERRPRTLEWPHGLRIRITAREVWMEREAE